MNSGLGNLVPKFASRILNNNCKYIKKSIISNVFKMGIIKKSDIQKYRE